MAQPAASADDAGSNIHDLVVGEYLTVDSALDSDGDTDLDSSLGDDGASSSSTSLASAVTDSKTYYGRRYHAFDDGAYWLPNDEGEISRLELQHVVWRLCLGGRLHIAPIPHDIHRAIDIGTGTGQWAIEFADEHPSATVIGTDLSPIQPTFAPPNCSFIVENAADPWVFSEPFDYCHSRMLLLGMHDWPRYFQQCWDHLKPGGWVEVQETTFPICYDDDSVPDDAPLKLYSEYVRDAAKLDGIDPNPAPKFRGILEKLGFVDIREQPLKWPMGSWPKGESEKELGRIMVDNMKRFYRPSATALFTKKLGWSVERLEEFLPGVGRDIEDESRHYYWQMQIVVARKPEAAE